MNEASKAKERYLREGTFSKYFADNYRILDIGCGDDKIVPHARGWDVGDGDAQNLVGLEGSFDVIFSSHCLEHLRDPQAAVARWWKVLKPNGRMIIIVPDEDTYEHCTFPSIYNTDHKWTFSLYKPLSWSPAHVDLLKLVTSLPLAVVESARTFGETQEHIPVVDREDRTRGEREACCEVVVRKGMDERGKVVYSNLKTVITCGHCGKTNLRLVGLNTSGTLNVWCGDCGVFGEIELEKEGEN